MYIYTHFLFILQSDLIHTIGESAALGAAGFVIWGDLNLTSSRVRFLTTYIFKELLTSDDSYTLVKTAVYQLQICKKSVPRSPRHFKNVHCKRVYGTIQRNTFLTEFTIVILLCIKDCNYEINYNYFYSIY